MKSNIQFKLRIGLVSQIILILIIVSSLIVLNSRIKKISENSNLLMNESVNVQRFAFSVKDYFNHTADIKTLKTEYDTLMATINSSEYKNILENIWVNLVSIENKKVENDSIEKQIIKLTENTIAKSNAYLMSISKKLAGEESRQSVSTLERIVIASAAINADLNHTIKYMFSDLKQDIRLKNDFLSYVDKTVQNTSKDIIRLRHTQFAMILVRSREANETIKQLSEKYIINEENIIKLSESSSNASDNLLVSINKTNIDNTNQSNSQIVRLMIIAFFILILISLVVIVLNGSISANIGKFIKRFTKYILELGSGNLAIKLDQSLINKSDEFGIIARALNETVEKISSTLEQINREALAISEISTQLGSSSQQISQGANEQATSIEEVSSSMEEMMANIEQNSENAVKTEDISKNSASGVEKVGSSAQKSLASVKDIVSKITIVNDIAFQTNLLALNAAVEAARAGEHGKGFAVVASEVRKLAERSKIAADEIDKLSKSSLNVTEDAEELMQNIIPEIMKTSQLVQEIASASSEQRSGAEQINNALQQLNNITQQNASASEELASSALELAERGEELKRTINFFKTNNNSKTIERKNFITNEFSGKNTMKKEPVTTTSDKKEHSLNVLGNANDKDFESF